MITQTVELQARAYIFDLKNCASEFNFTTDETWEVSLVTEGECFAIKRQFHPTIAVKLGPENSVELFELVKQKLSKACPPADNTWDTGLIKAGQTAFLIAYNPARPSKY